MSAMGMQVGLRLQHGCARVGGFVTTAWVVLPRALQVGCSTHQGRDRAMHACVLAARARMHPVLFSDFLAMGLLARGLGPDGRAIASPDSVCHLCAADPLRHSLGLDCSVIVLCVVWPARAMVKLCHPSPP